MFQVRIAAVRSLAALSSLCAFLLICGQSGAQEDLFDKALSYRASDYCRGVAAGAVALSEDQTVLCLDGLARLFKTMIVYETYPEGQAEVDEMVARLHLDMKVVYDPQVVTDRLRSEPDPFSSPEFEYVAYQRLQPIS